MFVNIQILLNTWHEVLADKPGWVMLSWWDLKSHISRGTCSRIIQITRNPENNTSLSAVCRLSSRRLNCFCLLTMSSFGNLTNSWGSSSFSCLVKVGNKSTVFTFQPVTLWVLSWSLCHDDIWHCCDIKVKDTLMERNGDMRSRCAQGHAVGRAASSPLCSGEQKLG